MSIHLIKFSTCALLVGLMAAPAMGAELTWDHNADGTASDGSGIWTATDKWVNGGSTTWNSLTPDNATIGSGGSGGNINLGGGSVTVGTATFNNYTGTYQLSNGTLVVNTELIYSSPTGKLQFNADSGLAGSGTITIDASYPVGKETNGLFDIWSLNQANNTFDGTYHVRNGVLFTQHSTNAIPDADSTIILDGRAGDANGAVYSSRWVGSLTRNLGSGPGEIQVIGNRSGFEQQGSGFTIQLNNDSATPIVWGAFGEGAATGDFNPNELILQSPNANISANLTFNNTLDLNGADRTISVDKESPYSWDNVENNANSTGGAQMAQAMVGTGGLVKEGVGQLFLNVANTYTGGTTVNEGILTYRIAAAMASTGTTTFNDGSQLRVEIGNADEFNDTGTGAGTINGLLNGVGNGGATVNYNGDVDVVIALTQNNQNLNLDLSDLGGGGTTTNLAIIDRDFTLSGNNTFSGTLKVSKRGGSTRTMKLGSSTALQNASVILDTTGSTSLDLNGFNAKIANLILGSNNGGGRGQVIDNVGGGILTITDGVNVLSHNGGAGQILVDILDLNGTEQTFDVQNSSQAFDLIIDSVIQNGSVRITSNNAAGAVRFNGTNTYVGTTTVQTGILSTSSSTTFADASSIVVESGAKLNLDFVGIDQIAALTLGGDVLGEGIYDATDLTYGSFFTGTGQLQIVPEPGTLALLGLGGLLIARRRRDD